MQKKMLIILGIAGVFALGLVGCSAQQDNLVRLPMTVTLSECVLGGEPGTGQSVEAQCGIVEVPENPADANGRTISLNVAVIPAVSRAPKADAIFLLAGGPGQAATEAFPLMFESFERLNQDRDLVLFDQRGTGQSNPLVCWDDEEIADLDEAAVIERLKSCPATLDADVRYYTTESSARDIEAVRIALGYPEINIYGASYGTRLALAYQSLYPESVRSLVLDSVVSPDLVIYGQSPADGLRSLEILFERCDEDASCRSAFPDLEQSLIELLDYVDAETPEVTYENPRTGASETFTLDRDILMSQIFALLYTPESVALLPLTLQSASEGDFSPLIVQSTQLDSGIYTGLFYAIACSEEYPRLDSVSVPQTIFGEMDETLREICPSWPRGSVPGDLFAPVMAETPALLLSGEADPITPPQYAEQVHAGMPNSLHLIADGMGHGIMMRGCVSRLVTNFIDAGSIDGLDASCVDAITGLPFFVNINGPVPQTAGEQ